MYHKIHIFGINRSGIHGITSWLIYQNFGSLLRKPKNKTQIENFMKQNGTAKCFYFTHENYNLRKIDFDSNNDCKNILIIRDPYNHFASILKRPRTVIPTTNEIQKLQVFMESQDVCQRKNRPMQNAIELWLQYAEEALNITNYFPKNKLVIKYNTWFTNKSYRKEISRELNFKFSDAGLNKVMTAGNGSSFDNMKYNGKAQNMKTEDRWKFYENFSWYKNIFEQNEKLIIYSKQLFDFCPLTFERIKT